MISYKLLFLYFFKKFNNFITFLKLLKLKKLREIFIKLSLFCMDATLVNNFGFHIMVDNL